MEKQEKPLSSIIYDQVFEKHRLFGLNRGTGYLSEDVDEFLTRTGKQVQEMENNLGRLYEFYKLHKNRTKQMGEKQNVSSVNNPSVEKTNAYIQQTNNSSVEQITREMQGLLENAVKRSEAMRLEAQAEADDIVSNAKTHAQEIEKIAQQKLSDAEIEARKIIEDAQARASEIDNQSNEKMKQLVEVKREIESKAQSIRSNFEQKALEIENMGEQFREMGQNIRKLINEKTA